MKRTFHIAPVDVQKSDVLLFEFSQDHVCLARAAADSKKIKGLSYYELRNLLEPEKLHDILQSDENAGTDRIVVSSALRNVILIPASQFTEEGAKRIFSTMYGNNDTALFFNDLPKYNVVLVHAVPQELMRVLKSTEATHFFYTALEAGTVTETEAVITVHFTQKKIYVTAVKEAQLQIAQPYFYTAPLDVVYYLLSICRQYGFSQSDTPLILSGLISEDSALYKELHQYFSLLQFWKPAMKTELQSDDPPHFFSSLYNLAACAL